MQPLVRDPLFTVEAYRIDAAVAMPLAPRVMQILAVLTGAVAVEEGQTVVRLSAGQFCLVPASVGQAKVRAEGAADFLRVEAGEGEA